MCLFHAVMALTSFQLSAEDQHQRNHSSQSQTTQKIKWTNQNGKLFHVADAKHRKTGASDSRLVCFTVIFTVCLTVCFTVIFTVCFTVIFHTEEGLYTRNVCVYRQFWHFSIIISLIINLNFYFQVARITNDVSVAIYFVLLLTGWKLEPVFRANH